MTAAAEQEQKKGAGREALAARWDNASFIKHSDRQMCAFMWLLEIFELQCVWFQFCFQPVVVSKK